MSVDCAEEQQIALLVTHVQGSPNWKKIKFQGEWVTIYEEFKTGNLHAAWIQAVHSSPQKLDGGGGGEL